MRKFLISITFITLAFAANAEECHIDSDIWFTTGYEEQDVNLCQLEWAVTEVHCNPAPYGSGAAATFQVFVELLGEDDDRLNTLSMRADGNSQIWDDGKWIGLENFSKQIQTRGCFTS